MELKNKPENKRLFIGSLPYRLTEGELLSLFIPFGKIIAVRIIHTRWGKSRGIGYIEFESIESAVKAKEAMHNHRLEDRTIIVDYSKPDPFDTPEGQQRHQDAQERRQHRFKFNKNKPSPTPKADADFPVSRRGFSGKKIRQSVYDQRTHGAKTGAKFASKTRKQKRSR